MRKGKLYSKASYMYHKKTIFSCLLLWIFVIANFFTNVWKYKGYDVTGLINPVRMLLLSSESGGWHFYFMQLYPILVVLPAGFSLWNDFVCGNHILQITRCGKKSYYISKVVSTFCVTFHSFFLPLISELVWTVIAFPINMYGNTYGVNAYDSMYISMVKKYPLYPLFVKYPLIYTVLWILFFSMISGCIAVFAMSLAVYIRRFKVALLLPVYVLLYGMAYFRRMFALPFSTNYFECLSMLSGATVNMGICTVAVLLLLSIAGVILVRSERSDVLQ